MSNLWDGRFENEMAGAVAEFNASIGFDKRLYDCDIDGSVAHAAMLGETGIITRGESDRIIAALEEIRRDIADGKITFSVRQEDIHMAVEEELTARIGDAGKKLHTARSRNDQVQVDVRLFFMRETKAILEELIRLESAILEKANGNREELIVGFTHMQHAQPVTVGFHLMAYFQMFRRDMERLADARRRADKNPLGSGALSGTAYPIDRDMTTKLLGFGAPAENAMDAVSDRDYIIEFLAAAAISMMHVSRVAEEFVYWNSSEFKFIAIDDAFCTGSSMMPQKKNPDVAELLRGKTGRVYGGLVAMLTVMKGTPLAFNKDFQEDKEPLFDAVDTWKASIKILREMIMKTQYRREEIDKHLAAGFMSATDFADALTRQGIPFRESHNIVGRVVKLCESRGCDFKDIKKDDLLAIDSRFEWLTIPDLSARGLVNARASFGGTAPSEVERQIKTCRAWLDGIKR
ncbi:MAG: argininosuccinate lyase [Synergistaceae bacterium]|jgi:argininosuccinate lyase|nr:argininosuccinate lyase [Synergistaceae bacterium]